MEKIKELSEARRTKSKRQERAANGPCSVSDTQLSTAIYIRDMTGELARLAKEAKLTTAGQLLSMVELDLTEMCEREHSIIPE